MGIIIKIIYLIRYEMFAYSKANMILANSKRSINPRNLL